MNDLRDRKTFRQTDEDFLDFIRDRRYGTCWICHNTADPDHLDHKGGGGSDYTCGRLCRKHHSERHQLGNKRFEKKYGINLWRCQNRELRRYMDEHPEKIAK